MRRNTKTMYEWRKAYRDKEELMLERGFPEVSPHEFYRDLFPEGSLQSAEHDGKGNVIATQIRPSGKGRTKQWVIDDSLNMLDKVIGDEFGLIPPITFYGKTQKLKAFRESRGYSQNQLADYLGIERSSYTRYETGETEPSLFALKKLSILYGVSADFLLDIHMNVNYKLQNDITRKYKILRGYHLDDFIR